MGKLGENVLFFIDKVVDFMVLSQVFWEYLKKFFFCNVILFGIFDESVLLYL